MNLNEATTEELRKELHRREEAERKEHWRRIYAAFPCPECGADPQKIDNQAVEEYRFAPRDDQGRLMLWAPPEMGTTGGMRYRTTVVCLNGHEWYKDDFTWFDKPHKGPPILSR